MEILTNKALFREFLHQNGFNAPKGISFSILKEGLENISKLNFPLILKPVDSSGSKGVYKINSKEDLKRYFTSAIKYSRIKKVILEEWISYDGFQIAGDGFSIDGNLVFCGFANEHFNNNSNSPFVPICESFPYIGDQKIQKLVNPSLQSKIEKLIEEINDTNEKTHNIFEKQEGLMKTSQSFSLSTSKLRKIAYEYEFVNKELTMLIEKYNAQSDANIKRMDELLTLYKEIPKQFKSAQKIIQPKFEYELTILGNKK